MDVDMSHFLFNREQLRALFDFRYTSVDPSRLSLDILAASLGNEMQSKDEHADVTVTQATQKTEYNLQLEASQQSLSRVDSAKCLPQLKQMQQP